MNMYDLKVCKEGQHLSLTWFTVAPSELAAPLIERSSIYHYTQNTIQNVYIYLYSVIILYKCVFSVALKILINS